MKKVHKDGHAISALMRQKTYHAETGFVLFDNSMEHFNIFLEHYKDFYERDLLFKLPQWHDAYIFTVIAHDMVKEDVIFCATGVTDGDLVKGIVDVGDSFKSETLVLHKSSKTNKIIKNQTKKSVFLR